MAARSCQALVIPAPGGLGGRSTASIKVLGFFFLKEHFRGAHFVGPFNTIMPSVLPHSPLSRSRGWEVVVLRAYCGWEHWDSWGKLCCCLLSLSMVEPLQTMAGNVFRLCVAPASLPAGALSGWGRCFARAALFGADKLRKPGCRMEGSVKSLEPGAAELRSGFPRHGRRAAILERALQSLAAWGRACCGVEVDVGPAASIFQSHSVTDELLKPLSYGGSGGPHTWPQASCLGGCAGAILSSRCIQGPLGLPRPPRGSGQGVELSWCSLDLSCHDRIQLWLNCSDFFCLGTAEGPLIDFGCPAWFWGLGRGPCVHSR